MIRILEAFDRVLTTILGLCLWLHVAWVLLLKDRPRDPSLQWGKAWALPGRATGLFSVFLALVQSLFTVTVWRIVLHFFQSVLTCSANRLRRHQTLQHLTSLMLRRWFVGSEPQTNKRDSIARRYGRVALILGIPLIYLGEDVKLMFTLALAQTPRPRPRTAPSVYYVSPQGNNANACATARAPGASARRTLNGAQGAIACLAPGDTLLVQDGIYNEQLADLTDAEHPGTTRPPNGLSWSQPTTIKAEHPRGATLNKPGAGHPYGHVVMFGYSTTQYISVEGLVIDGRGHNTCVWVGPSSHIRFQNNVIKNCGSNGIFGTTADDKSGGTDIQLIDNEIFNVSVEAPQPPGTHGIYFTGNNSVARGNYIHAPCPHYGMQYSSELGGLYSNVIENNRVSGCDMAGIITQGRDTVVRNNLLENNCIGLYLSHDATTVANNTIYGWRTTPHCPDSYGIFDKSYGSTLTNNLVLQQVAGWASIYAMHTPPTVRTNLCDQTGSTACTLQAAASSVVVDGPGGNLTLKPGGPAIDTGTATTQVPTDLLGVARPQGSGYDIGAYEYTTSAPPIQPPVEPPVQPPVASITCTGMLTAIPGPVTLQCEPAGARR